MLDAFIAMNYSGILKQTEEEFGIFRVEKGLILNVLMDLRKQNGTNCLNDIFSVICQLMLIPIDK